MSGSTCELPSSHNSVAGNPGINDTVRLGIVLYSGLAVLVL